MTRFRIPRNHACVLIVLALALAACNGAATDERAADDAPNPADAVAQEGEGNLTEGCITEFEEGRDYFPDKVELDHAQGLAVVYADTHKIVDVTVPGLGSPVRYVLVQCGAPAPELDTELQGAYVLEVPIASAVTLTTTNLPHFDALDAVDRLVGVGTGAFVSTPPVLERVEAGELPDFADASGQPDAEGIIGADPDVLVIDGFGDTILDEVNRFSEAGIPTVVNADFNEGTLLGRAEWLKLTGMLLNAEAQAEAVFGDIEAAYTDVVERAAQTQERPSVLANAPFEGTWFMPGGNSFLANAIADAGGDYVFADDESTGSIQLDIESVLDRAGDADVWIQAGSVEGTLDDLLAQDPRFAEFRAFSAGEVYAWDAMVTEQGGNAVFELAYTRADLFIADLFAILHPEQGGDHELVFYGPVPEGDGTP
jgi:iron complex transport system substrate-binding protein